jgi:hypothetical protein
MSVNMADFTAPKSDQLNADDLIAGPRTITITGVRANGGDGQQPVSISFAGDDGKPYKPCKSMRRAMVHVWGADAKQYIGRSMTLYCDPSVIYGGMAVGGIRISHMSNMDKAQTFALTATKTKRVPFTVQPLTVERAPLAPAVTPPTLDDYDKATTQAAFDALEVKRAAAWPTMTSADKKALSAKSVEIKALLALPSVSE